MPQKSSAARKSPEPTMTRLRSAISNGSQLFVERLDQRSAWARRLKDLIADHLSDLGGPEAVSHAESVIVRRAAMLTLQVELMEQRFAQNEAGEASAKQIETYQRTTNTLRRTLESLGLQRRQRDVTPTLSAYLRSRVEEADEYDEAESAE